MVDMVLYDAIGSGETGYQMLSYQLTCFHIIVSVSVIYEYMQSAFGH